MVITSKGQVTIPIGIREKTGLLPHTEIDFVVEGRAVRIVRAKNRKHPTRGERIVARLRASGPLLMSTDEIMALTRGE